MARRNKHILFYLASPSEAGAVLRSADMRVSGCLKGKVRIFTRPVNTGCAAVTATRSFRFRTSGGVEESRLHLVKVSAVQ